MIYNFVSVLVILQCLSVEFVNVEATKFGSVITLPSSNPRTELLLRGGSSSPPSKSGKRKKQSKKKKKRKLTTTTGEEKKVIGEAMKEKDAADALGDAIRERADVLKSDDMENPLLQKIDQSVSSVGYAMGSSDQPATLSEEEDVGGGVEAAPMSVLANYFLKSHGGAHAVQCACSGLAALSAFGALLLRPSNPLRLVLMKRAMLFAMTKHMSGLLAATSVAAKAIPEVGLRRARTWIEKLARDPVSQYVFYAALVLLWLPNNASDAWWWDRLGTMAPVTLVGPILLRESVSTAFVISDILVLLTTSAGKEGTTPQILQATNSVMNAFMSILVTPQVWRNSDAPTRQAILAKLTSRVSLALELLVGLLITMDGLMALWEFSISPMAKRPPFTVVGKRLLCARLYLNFLWVRRRKISKLGANIRGGAAQFPLRVIDVLMNPASSMGLEVKEKEPTSDPQELTWRDYAKIGLGLD